MKKLALAVALIVIVSACGRAPEAGRLYEIIFMERIPGQRIELILKDLRGNLKITIIQCSATPQDIYESRCNFERDDIVVATDYHDGRRTVKKIVH